MAIVMLALSVTISKIFAVEIVRDHDLDLCNGSRLNATILIEIPYMTLFGGGNYMTCYLMTIVIFILTVTISKIFTVEICLI